MCRPHVTVIPLALAMGIVRALAAPAPSQVTFHVSFDTGLDADTAAGNPKGQWKLKDSQPRFSEGGIRGRAFIAEKNGEAVYFEGKDNLPADAWTMTFWVRGLAGADWNRHDANHMELVELFGPAGWTRFYKYQGRGTIFLLTEAADERGKKEVRQTYLPGYTVTAWRHHAIVWKKGRGVELYLDGVKVAEDRSHEVIEEVSHFRIGQSFGAEDQPRLIDELIIRRGAVPGNELYREYLTVGNFRTPQLVRVTQTDRPPVIDGRIGDGEWSRASAVSGFLDAASWQPFSTPTRVSLLYDTANLYVAFHSPIPAQARARVDETLLRGIVKADATRRDQDVHKDDFVGIAIRPNGLAYPMYSLGGNALGTQRDFRSPTATEEDFAWNPSWHMRSQTTIEGWTAEMAIPLSVFGDGAPRDDDVWVLDLARRWERLKSGESVWSWGRRDVATGARSWAPGGGELVFGGAHNVSVQVTDVGKLHDGQLDLNMRLCAVGAPAEVLVRVSTESHELKSETLSLGANESKDWRLASDLTQLGAGAVFLEVTSADGDTIYYRQQIPFYVPERITLDAKQYPSRKLLRVLWQVRSVDAPAERLRGRFVVVAEGTETPVLTDEVRAPLPSDGSRNLDIASLKPGRYTVIAELLDGNDAVAERKLPFAVAPLPDWYGNEIGISDQVPPPWTPVERDDDTVRVWGREIDYGGSLFPRRLTTRAENILAGPVALRTKQGSSADTKAQVEWQETKPTAARCVRAVDLGGLQLRAATTTEFDGFTWIDLTVQPEAESTNVEALTFVVPLKPEWAELINPYDYGTRLTGALPEDGFAGTMRPLWLGNRTGGIQVIAETDATWLVEDPNRELEVVRVGDVVELRLHFLDHPVALDKPLRIAFGYLVTPVKPAPPRYRHWRIYNPRGSWQDDKWVNTHLTASYERAAMEAKRDVEVMAIWATGWGAAHAKSGEVYYPIPREGLQPRDWARPLKWGGTAWFFPYYQLHNFWAECPEFRQFGDEWLANVRETYLPKSGVDASLQTMTVCQNARSFQDFVLSGLNKLMDETNPRGFYFDVSRPIECNNVYHGCGHQTEPDAAPQRTTNFLGTRRLAQRLYTMLKQRREDGLIFFHMSGQIAMPVYSFCDAMVDGENYTGRLDRKENRGYEKFLDLDTFAAQYNCQNNMGPVTVFLPEFQRSGSITDEEWAEFGTRPADYVFGLMMLHDSQLWWAYIHYEQLMKLFTALDEADWGHDYEFLPYWEQKIVELPEGVVASFYKDNRKPRVLAVIMNFGEQPVEVKANLDLAQLGLRQGISARDVLHAEAAALAGTALGCTIPAKTFRLLRLEST